VPGVPRPEARRRATTKISLRTIVKLSRGAPGSKERPSIGSQWGQWGSFALNVDGARIALVGTHFRRGEVVGRGRDERRELLGVRAFRSWISMAVTTLVLTPHIRLTLTQACSWRSTPSL
jgi:hypothetical protein